MGFQFGETVLRDRRRKNVNPYSKEIAPGDWADVDTIPIEGAFVAASSSIAVSSATRTEILTAKSLYCDPADDVLVGDRIRVGDDSYQVNAKPAADVNPFTGWQPIQEIPLGEASG
ncbi:hypothetical protein E3O55_08480 [Cryobacterium sp. MDB1-18-2]|uniref:hypothetical protein n=1 Tax=unclassified Cryobacterium TaxID=2649013 RepID=UPI00106D8A11|nr:MULTISPECIES: hypothetical protein [unclassified Cryobacterium]TFC30109.1 hypothetical protein E3O55_08480 [Cryobacterium sp. MDB1-18-2]TFC41389.1 hypothetical protein E3O50_09920 [Cryobacterium sp. MDB1-18-1]